jgi:hypothetical protein
MNALRHIAPFASLVVVLACASCGGTPPADDAGSDTGPVDGGPRDAGMPCTSATACDDGLWCNGIEACTGGVCVPGTAPQCDDGVGCTFDACSEELRRCVNRVPDADRDGVPSAACLDAMGQPLGTDCDDTDANRYPGNREVCDTMMHDEDCDATTHGGLDADNDGFESSACCNGTMCGTDCNDGRPDVHPMATEVCNLGDDDCDTHVDEGVAVMVYADADRDGYGAGAGSMRCGSTGGYSVYDTDCDDADPANHPGQPEFCDARDNDCDTRVDESAGNVTWYADNDMDGFGAASSGTLSQCTQPAGYSLLSTDCDDTTNTRSPARAEICDGLDDDCNGAADFAIAPGNLEDDDRDGVADAMCGMPYGIDCNDLDPTIGGGAPETCDGRDNDCDGHVDEGAMSQVFYRDGDGDGYGSAAVGTIVACTPTGGYVRASGDCDDTSAARHPGGMEGCNDLDDDCDGAIDEGEASVSCTTAHTQTVCVRGACVVLACDTGYADCSALVAGCEASLASDPRSCGRCGNVCPPLPNSTPTCTSGVCGTRCAMGFGDCNAQSFDGCESPTTIDPLNCGTCGHACASEPNAMAPCAAGACGALTCVGGYFDCNGDLGTGGDGCESLSSACTPPVSSGLVAHYDAMIPGSVGLAGMDAGIDASAWSDRTANHFDLVSRPGTYPRYAMSVIAGHPAMDFAGSNGMITGGPSPSLVSTASLTVFIVMQQRVPAMWGNVMHHGDHDYNWSFRSNAFSANAPQAMHWHSVNDNSFCELILANGVNYVVAGRINGTARDYTLTSGGTTQSTNCTGNSISAGAPPLYLGTSDSNEQSNAAIGEVLYFDRALSDTERDMVVAYLTARWGI